MPRVSVIVPCYNHLKYLPERLGSIFGQTFDDFEVILVDDGSTDGSREYLEALSGKDKVSAVITGDANSGSAFRQWKKGFGAASGELVWIAESDDACSPGMLETLVAEFDRDPACVLAFCASMLTAEDGSPMGIHPYQQQIGKDLRMDGKAFVRRWQMRNNCIVNASGALFKKSTLDAVDDAFLGYSGAGDWLFWAEVAVQGNVAFVWQPLNRFRRGEGNTTAAMKRSGRALAELCGIRGDFERIGFRSPILRLSNRVYAVSMAKYGPPLPDGIKAEVLEQWKDNAFISLLARLKAKVRTSYS